MTDPRAIRRSRLIVAAVAVASALLTALTARQRGIDNRAIERARFTADAALISDQIIARLEVFEYGLRGMRGAVQAMGEHGVNRAGITEYAKSRDIDREFAGARGFGFVRRVAAADEASFVTAAAADGWPGFAIRQLDPSPGERYVIQYIEPVARSRAAIGIDIA
ncbi:MAG TPA: CHASE domain-containing protein, partial [Kofleriaceae bacterium]